MQSVSVAVRRDVDMLRQDSLSDIVEENSFVRFDAQFVESELKELWIRFPTTSESI